MTDHPPCYRCGTREPGAFQSPTSTFCRSCWAWQIDPDRRFRSWADEAIWRARRGGRGPFYVPRRGE